MSERLRHNSVRYSTNPGTNLVVCRTGMHTSMLGYMGR